MPTLLEQALAAHRAGNTPEAERLIRADLKAAPKSVLAHRALATVLLHQGKAADAEQSFERAATLGANDAPLFFSMGHSQLLQEKWQAALSSFDNAIAREPKFLEAIANRGVLLQQMNRVQEALAAFETVLTLNPNLAEGHNMRGTALVTLARADDAIAAFRRALAIDPRHTRAWFNLGAALARADRYDEAVAAYDAGLKIEPNPQIALARYFTGLYLADWHEYDAKVRTILASVDRGAPLLQPFQSMFLPASLEQKRKIAEHHAQLVCPPQKPMFSTPRKPGRLRIAYVSKDIRNHATPILIAEMLERHDRSQFEIFVISTGVNDGSPMRARVESAAEHFIDLRMSDDRLIAARLAEYGIDIAVDLDGFTHNPRPAILSYRPAPVQVSFLGFPGTMGAAHIDYFISDAVLTPPDHAPYYSEKLVLMPDTYQPNTRRERAEAPTRAEAGLPENGFVFGSFNESFKITPATFDVWMRILSRVPGSVLWLFGRYPALHANLRKEAQKRGVDGNRLIFAERVNLEQHIARLAHMDLFLDTFTCGAHTTASDTLWAGVPLVTKLGETFSDRVAASLLTAVGLPELITHSAEEYENLAVALASDPARHTALKVKLKSQLETAPLFDAPRFTRNLESAYRSMWARHESGEAPEAFSVT